MTELQDPWLRDLLLWWIAVPFLTLLAGSIGAVFAVDWWRGRGEHTQHIWRERAERREHS